MALTPNAAVQCPRVAFKRFTAADAAGIASAAQSLFEVPTDAIVTGGELVIVTPFGSSRTFDVGDVADPNRYTASAIDANTAGRTALTLTGFKHSATEAIKLTLAAGAEPTVGEAWVRLEYIIEGAMEYVQG